MYIDNKYKPKGYNIGWNVGNIGGQEIFHARLHVIPRYEDEPFAGKGIRYWLKQPQNKRVTDNNRYKKGEDENYGISNYPFAKREMEGNYNSNKV